MCVVYKATCKICDDSYIGQTQQKLKDRMGQHLNDVKKLITKGIKLDSFVSHFTHHCKKEVKANKWWAMQNDESQDRLARKCDKLHEVIWKIELFIV
jgi:predicted GIY-YIG superfamily endonuclease